MRNHYKDVMEHIEIPENVIQETSQLMERERNGKQRSLGKTRTALILACCLVLFISGSYVFLRTVLLDDRGPSFITNLQADKNTVYVELEEGTLTFEKQSNLSDMKLKTGKIEGDRKEATKKEVEDHLNIAVEPPYLPADYQLEEATYALYQEQEEMTATIDLKYTQKNSSIHLYMVENDEGSMRVNSEINDIPLYTEMYVQGLNTSEKIFYGKFQKGNILYELRSDGLKQEEFIKILYFLTK